MTLIDWAMRRLLSVNRDAADHIFKAPDDGRKWTISALAWARQEGDAIAWIDSAFWPGHCEEAFAATIQNLPLETRTWRARRGAARVLWRLATQWWRLPKPKGTKT